MSTSDNTQASAIQQYASRLFKPEELIEYRAKGTDGSFRGLYFTDQQRLGEVVAKLDSDGRALVSYVCINPLKQRLIRERGLIVNPTDEQVNQIISGPPGKTARDEDIEVIRWMFIDIDTVRAAYLLKPDITEADKKEFDRLQHECSTDEEKAAAKAVAQKVLAYLGEKGWPQPLLCDSGNGFHILFRVNLQNTPFNVNQVADCLKALKLQFASETAADIDSSVYNPARLTRAYGSTTRKGTDTPERPYRRNRIFPTSAPVGDVTLDNILQLAIASPGYSKHSDGDMPELDESFDPQDWIAHFEKQGAFVVEGDKEWQGKPILATDICLYAGRKHSGAEFKSGFIIGDTFGYKCFSDECEGKTIKEIYAWLREEKDDQGNPLYVPYDKPIYKTDTLDELKAAFHLVDLNDVDREQQALVAAKSVDAPAPEVVIQPGEPEINKKRLKHEKVLTIAGHVIACIFRDPVGLLPKFIRLKSHISSTILEHVAAPVHEVLAGIMGFYEDTRLLPNRAELLNWLQDSTHSGTTVAKMIRDKSWFPDVLKYIRELKDDETKEFTAQVTELSRATALAQQRKVTKFNYDTYLSETSETQDLQAFRIAERKHTQKELRSSGDILPGPIQEMTEELAQLIRNDFDGANDAWKFETGFEAIDSTSHIGLGGERTIFVYGANNSFKTTFLMTIAINAARKGKNGLILVGEHQALPMMKTLLFMLGHFTKDDPEIGPLPSKADLEGINRKATEEDWRRIRVLLDRLRDYLLLPGHLGVQNISALAQTDDDRLGAVIDYIHAFNMEYPLDFVVIDPLDQVMPLSAASKDNAWQEGKEVLQRIQGLSRSFEGRSGRGLMVFTSAQFTSKFQREIEKEQAKNATTMDAVDDKIISLMEQASQVQFFTTIPQDLDFGIGIVTRIKGGREGYLVRGRTRFASTFQNVSFTADPVSNVLVTGSNPTLSAKAFAAPSGRAEVIEAFDVI